MGKIQLQFQIGTIRVKHPAYIADIHDNCILGLDFLREHDFVVDLQENLLHSKGEEVPLCSRERARSHAKSVSVILKEDAVIPARSEAIIPGALSEDPGELQLAVSEPSPQKPFKRGIRVARTVLKVQNTIPVRVINIQDSPKHLKRGEELCHLEPVSSVVLPQRCDKDHAPKMAAQLPDCLKELTEGSSLHLDLQQRT
ncbi:hypothetical protein JGG76_24295, partial [Salmonella enterica subsp. enterica serovar Derby]|nr:hypothetical protein [Salmonella enterica subsp. enterica serovar Derby]